MANLKSRVEKLESKIHSEDYIVFAPSFKPDGSVIKHVNNEIVGELTREEYELEVSELKDRHDYYSQDIVDIKVKFGGE